MKVQDSPLAKALLRGRKHDLPPSGGYARVGRVWVLPGAKGVRLMLRLATKERPAGIEDVTVEKKSGYPQLTTSDESVARKFIVWAEDVAKATGSPAGPVAAGGKPTRKRSLRKRKTS